MKAFSYLRVSSKGQIDGDGFPRQRQAVKQYAKSKSISIVQEFRDEGVKGANDLENREGLSDLMVAIKSNGVRLVLVEKADRFARDLMVGEILLAEFRKHEVKVITSEGIDLTENDDPTRKLIRQVLGAVAEFEKCNLVIKLRAARNRIRRKQGYCEGSIPYGLHPDHPEEKALVKQVLTLYRKPRKGKRLSVRKIADTLNSDGHRTRKGTLWTHTQVHRIISFSKSKK